jgi:hypothetical protein
MNRKSYARRHKRQKRTGGRSERKVGKMSEIVSPEDRQTEIDGNLDFFLNEMPNLPQSQLGKFALLRKKSIVGYFDTIVDAVGTGNKLYQDKVFSVQQVTDVPVDLGFFSHAGSLGKSQ